ncbi:MAG: hypothetical protein M3Y67_10285, partial [Pseudomonadota bacterium]|nr:hypothetical protein [Pseudomonadota bacterium]
MAAQPRSALRSAHVGINLAGVTYWTTQFPFADLMKNGSGWWPRDRNGGDTAKLTLTSDGYPASLLPGQRAHNAVAWDDCRYVPGRYTVLWEGDGEIVFPGLDNRIASRSPKRVVLDIRDTRARLGVEVTRTNPVDPIHNIRFLWPGTEEADGVQRFTPEFLGKLAPFKTLRFMDWGATNGSPVARWSERAKPSDFNYTTERGVPLEVMIDLANTLQAEPWFCIPHLADDDYVRQFAALVKARLEPRLKATIEYSNEVWNNSFAQGKWALAESARLGLPAATGQA